MDQVGISEWSLLADMETSVCERDPAGRERAGAELGQHGLFTPFTSEPPRARSRLRNSLA
jgi:hypothetical protein